MSADSDQSTVSDDNTHTPSSDMSSDSICAVSAPYLKRQLLVSHCGTKQLWLWIGSPDTMAFCSAVLHWHPEASVSLLLYKTTESLL